MKTRIPSKLTSSHAAQPTEKESTAYRKTILDNGIRIVTEKIPYVRSVSVGLWIDTGSRDENESNNGISHFIEHMVFKGTQNRSIAEISRSLESVGGYLNAFTGKEQTCYYARVLDENTELAVDVLCDLVTNPTFPEKELEKEKGVVIEELKNAEDGPDEIIHDYLDKSLYGAHPMGFAVIGKEQNLRSFTRADIARFHSARYTPERIIVAASGSLEHDEIVRLVRRYFTKHTNGKAGDASSRGKPRQHRPERVEHEKPIQQSHVCIGTIAFNVKSKYRYPLLVLNTLLGDGMSSRLFQSLREKKGLAYSVYSFANLLSDTGTFGVYIGTDNAKIEQSLDLIWAELEKLKSKEISKAELRRTQAQLKGSMMLSLESIPNRMIRLGTSEVYFNELKSLDWIIRQIDAVDQEAIRDVAHQVFEPSKFATVVFKANGNRSADYLGISEQSTIPSVP